MLAADLGPCSSCTRAPGGAGTTGHRSPSSPCPPPFPPLPTPGPPRHSELWCRRHWGDFLHGPGLWTCRWASDRDPAERGHPYLYAGLPFPRLHDSTALCEKRNEPPACLPPNSRRKTRIGAPCPPGSEQRLLRCRQRTGRGGAPRAPPAAPGERPGRTQPAGPVWKTGDFVVVSVLNNRSQSAAWCGPSQRRALGRPPSRAPPLCSLCGGGGRLLCLLENTLDTPGQHTPGGVFQNQGQTVV